MHTFSSPGGVCSFLECFHVVVPISSTWNVLPFHGRPGEHPWFSTRVTVDIWVGQFFEQNQYSIIECSAHMVPDAECQKPFPSLFCSSPSHQPSLVRTRHALPSFPNAFLSRNAPSKKQLYVFFETYLRSYLLGEPCLIPQLLTDLSVSISLDLQNPTHILYSHCFLFSHWAGSFSRKSSSLHPQYLGYNRHSVSIHRESEWLCFPWYIVICFSSLFACFISVYPFFSNRLIDIWREIFILFFFFLQVLSIYRKFGAAANETFRN